MPREKVLVVGAGIAGSVCAYWLARHDFSVTVVERSKTEQTSGQGLEIEEPALEVVKAMGILDELRSHRTEEKGFQLVDDHARTWATLDAGTASPTGDLELMRGDLTEVLYKAADRNPNVTYRFETTLQNLRQFDDHVSVDLQHRPTRTTTTEDFDMVIAADGQRSRTRAIVMGSPEELHCYKPVGAYVAYFSIPKHESDLPYSKACHFSNRRLLWLRPVSKASPITSAYLMYLQKDVPSLRTANESGDRSAQKDALADIFAGCGWEVPRVIEEMKKSDNFYSEELQQVKLPTWRQDRVVLLGDSAWAPTPFTGQGNQLAIIGGFVLAQELSRNRDPIVAFRAYEERLRGYVETAQQIPLGGYGPLMLAPEKKWGIWMLRNVFWVVSAVVKVVSAVKWPKVWSESEGQREPEFDLQLGTEGEGVSEKGKGEVM